MLENYLTTEEFARLHNANIETVRQRIKRGLLPAAKVGRIYLIKMNEEWEDDLHYNSGRYKKGSTGNAVKSDKKNPS